MNILKILLLFSLLIGLFTNSFAVMERDAFDLSRVADLARFNEVHQDFLYDATAHDVGFTESLAEGIYEPWDTVSEATGNLMQAENLQNDVHDGNNVYSQSIQYASTINGYN